MCVTTANSAFMSDLIDYELDRGGRYVPAVVTGTASFIDKIDFVFRNCDRSRSRCSCRLYDDRSAAGRCLLHRRFSG